MSVNPARKLAIAERRQKVAKLYLEAYSQVEIAQKLGIAQPTISKDLDNIQKGWRQSAIRDFDAQRDLELARLNRIETEAWEAWERSKQPAQTAVVNGAAGSQSARRTVKHQNGDPRYLDIALRCGEERRKLLGLDAPVKIAPVTPDGRPLTIEQRRTHIIAILTEQFGGKALLQETSNESGPSEALAGEHNGRGTIEAQPAGDDEESLPAPAAG